MDERMDRLREKARNLTTMPGVYIMKNNKQDVIYIGKAKVLKNRVSSYFQRNSSHNEKVRKMVENVHDFDYIVCQSEFEALVLECSLIKQNQPKYNILLKDDKGYRYIHVSDGPYPRISAALQLVENGQNLGPFTSGYSVTQTVDEVNRIFRLPTCQRNFPGDFRKGRPCLNYHIQRCMGVCRGKVTQVSYAETIGQALSYIKKGGGDLIARLTELMEQASESMKFERAAQLRDRITAIKKIADTQNVYMINQPDQDVVAFCQNLNTAAACILKCRDGKLTYKEDFLFNDIADLSDTRQEFLNQFYIAAEGDIPKQIIIDEDFEGSDLLAGYLTEKYGCKITIKVPVIGEQKKLIDMAYQNASERLSKKVERTGREVAALSELSKLLGLASPPEYIEAYDISNMGDTGIVGGMVVFQNGRPYKKAYRKFKVEQEGRDDYRAMQEVLSRRFARYREEKDSGEGFGRLPDLILLDGGKGHVAAIEPVMAQYGLTIPLFGMVKDSKHKTRAIAISGGEIAIASYKSAFALVTSIQDEVHRFSINYQKTVHKKSSFELTLTRVEGIGPKKAQAILKTFKTKADLKAASVEQLREVAKINEEKANELYQFIQNVY